MVQARSVLLPAQVYEMHTERKQCYWYRLCCCILKLTDLQHNRTLNFHMIPCCYRTRSFLTIIATRIYREQLTNSLLGTKTSLGVDTYVTVTSMFVAEPELRKLCPELVSVHVSTCYLPYSRFNIILSPPFGSLRLPCYSTEIKYILFR
jgi:hypothetical protein